MSTQLHQFRTPYTRTGEIFYNLLYTVYMVKKLKQRLYFFVAHYFRFWAKIQLKRWNPTIVVITGSSGKTTTMHLLQSQLGEEAHYSHHANSSYGVCFDILDLHRSTLKKAEWIPIVFKAPIRAFKKPYTKKVYVVEVDCDRPHEGKFLADLLKPDAVVWLSSGQTHSVNFQSLVDANQFTNVEHAISFEFANLIEAAKSFVVLNKDNQHIVAQSKRTSAKVFWVAGKDCKEYEVSAKGVRVKTDSSTYQLSQLVPKESFYSLQACERVVSELGLSFDPTFKKFVLPPGRSSILKGIKNTTIIDSSYNSSADALRAMLQLFQEFKAQTKWLVIGDVLEQGDREAVVHKEAARDIKKVGAQKIILVGPRVKKYTAPELLKLGVNSKELVVYESPKDALKFLQKELKGREAILFKGARFLEGVIEHLLANKADIAKLCRREIVWENRRKKWGL